MGLPTVHREAVVVGGGSGERLGERGVIARHQAVEEGHGVFSTRFTKSVGAWVTDSGADVWMVATSFGTTSPTGRSEK
ncbi:hypothetical protein [Streptomyces sp. MJM1172]|uniref:hypothetical protein n=1 Tax=Streptomyces sp. MJM1172 TaxID=1703926 RepID=UPI00093FA191|nr:hypothetical protein [Streptomyces sp. MJM1172]OKI58258.1 hypothetical protein AMK15_23020 [Streptomyces sp. MJM1172]